MSRVHPAIRGHRPVACRIRKRNRGRRAGRNLLLESLEDRRLLAVSLGFNDFGGGAIEFNQLAEDAVLVTTLTDELDEPASDGDGISLREAIALSNHNGRADTISFDPALSGTIELDVALGQLEIEESLSIIGPGAATLTIDAGGSSRVIDVISGDGDLLLHGVTVTGGHTSGVEQGGAGIRFRSSGVLTLDEVVVTANRTSGLGSAGGGLLVEGGRALILHSTISENHTEGFQAVGGGLALFESPASIRASTLAGNRTGGEAAGGGGLHARATTVNLINSTVSGNHAGTETVVSDGGGIDINAALVNVDHSTITLNRASGVGGGIAASISAGPSLLTIENSIVANNQDDATAPDIDGSRLLSFPESVLYSLVGDRTGTTLEASAFPHPDTGNLVGDSAGEGVIDPQLLPLADNGGLTPTHALAASSPAIDAGDPGFNSQFYSPPLRHDQRGDGFSRVQGTVIDIGAIEAEGPVGLHWSDPTAIVYGTSLSDVQLNATAKVPGTFEYNPPAGVVLTAGLNKTLSVTFTPDDLVNFSPESTTVQIDVLKADPLVSWNSPGPIVVGMPLTAAQLNAQASVPGSFSYDPPIGTELNVGADQILTATFTPLDTNNFNVVTSSVSIDVLPAQDFGDAPSGYPVLLAEDGARHLPSSLSLGAEVDVDIDGQPSPDADGDGFDDDGIRWISSLVADSTSLTTASLIATASAAARLDGWIDFNRDGDWDDAGEQIIVDLAVAAGENLVSFRIPAGAASGDTAARFRISTSGGLAATGAADDGEVEDYLVRLIDGGGQFHAAVELGDADGTIELDNAAVVVRSNNDILFSTPQSSVGRLSVTGSAADQTIELDSAVDTSLPEGVHLDGAGGVDQLVLLGADSSYDLTTSQYVVENFESLNLASADNTRLIIDASAVSKLAPAAQSILIELGVEDEVAVRDADQWLMTQPIVVNGRFIPTAAHRGGDESILFESASSWHNPLQPGDVNNNGYLSAVDALRIINELARRTFSDPQTGQLVDPLSIAGWPNAYFDHNRDGRVSALDAVRVINDMAREIAAAGELLSPVAPPVDTATEASAGAVRPTRPVELGMSFSQKRVEGGQGRNRRLNNSSDRSISNPKRDRPFDELAKQVDTLLADQSFLAALR